MSLTYAPAAGGDVKADFFERLKQALTHELQREGFGGGRGISVDLVNVVVSWLLLSAAFVAPHQLGLSHWPFVVGLAVSLLLLWAVVVAFAASPAGGGVETASGWLIVLLVLASAGFGVKELLSLDLPALVRTHGAPLAFVFSIWLVVRRSRIAALMRSVPLFLPVVIGAPLVSLFSSDAWRVAAAIDTRRGIALAALSAFVSTLLWIVLTRRLCNSVRDVFETTANALAADSTTPDEFVKLLDSVVGKFWFLPFRTGDPGHDPFFDYARRVVLAAFGPSAANYADLVYKEGTGRRFKWKVMVRISLLIASIGVGLWFFIYGVAALAVSVDVAKTWTNRQTIDVYSFSAWQINVPLGPYLLMAAFLSVVATLIFLALALTRTEHSAALADVLLHRPITRCLLLAIPNTHMDVAGPQAELPLNDDFEAAYVLSEPAGTVRGTNVVATWQPGEPLHAEKSGGRSVWYRWTSPTSGTATIDTLGSDFDTLLAVYRGTTIDQLEVVDFNDDAAAGNTYSSVSFPAEEGVEYRIAVDGYGGRAGEIVLNWQIPPANDDFDRAELLTGPSGTIRGGNRGATKEEEEPDHAGDAGGGSVWYRWVAPVSGSVVIDTFGSDFDTLLAVYQGSSLGPRLRLVAANDDSGGGEQSEVRFEVQAGTEYRIAVDGYGGRAGEIVLNWQLKRPPDLSAHVGS